MGLEGKTFRHYHIRQLIGKGGMGEVYLLEDLRVQRQVAAKFIYLEGMSSSQEATDTLLHLFWRGNCHCSARSPQHFAAL